METLSWACLTCGKSGSGDGVAYDEWRRTHQCEPEFARTAMRNPDRPLATVDEVYAELRAHK